MKRSSALKGVVVAVVVATAMLQAAPAAACGGLVGENGTIQLVRTTTLAAYSEGVERYVTAFQFTGEGESVGSIVPCEIVATSEYDLVAAAVGEPR